MTPKENIVPPGGFHYKDPAGYTVEGHSYQSVADNLMRYRVDNKLPVGNPLKDVFDYVCNNWPHFCTAHNPVLHGGNGKPSLASRVSMWLSNLYHSVRVRGVEGNFVDANEATRRAAICRVCPQNQEWRDGCGSCMQSMQQVGFTFRAGRAVEGEKELKACFISGQENATAVWVKALPQLSQEEYEALPAACWRK